VARRSTEQRRLQPAMRKMTMGTSQGCQCNFLFFQGYLGMRGLDVKVL
jgi:hypothetical protein